MEPAFSSPYADWEGLKRIQDTLFSANDTSTVEQLLQENRITHVVLEDWTSSKYGRVGINELISTGKLVGIPFKGCCYSIYEYNDG